MEQHLGIRRNNQFDLCVLYLKAYRMDKDFKVFSLYALVIFHCL
ncbi:hypothetical protein M072_2733, partial [Bacteroides fragilis str. DS-208]